MHSPPSTQQPRLFVCDSDKVVPPLETLLRLTFGLVGRALVSLRAVCFSEPFLLADLAFLLVHICPESFFLTLP